MNRRSVLLLVAVLLALGLGLVWLSRALSPGGALGPGGPGEPSGPTAGAEPGNPRAEPATPASLSESPAVLPPPIESAGGAAPERKAVADAEAESELAAALWVEGRVVFPEGTPLDEKVEILAQGRRFRSRELHRASVGPDGSFRVAFAPETRKGRLELRARYLHLAEPFALVPAEPPASPPGILLEPRLGGCLRGRLILPPEARGEHAAVAGSTVRVFGQIESDRFDATSHVQRETKAGEDLEFEIGGLPAKRRYWLTAEPRGMVEVLREDVRIEEGRVTTLDLELRLGARLSGRVVDESGAGVEGVELSTRIQAGNTHYGSNASGSRTPAEGSFDLRGLRPGRIALEAAKAGFVSATFDAGEMKDGDAKAGAEIRLLRGLAVSGRVRWPDGAPAAGAKVEAQHKVPDAEGGLGAGETRTATVEAGSDGSFEITGLVAGPLTLTAEARRKAAAAPAPTTRAPAEPAQAGPEAEEPGAASASRKGRSSAWSARLEDVQAGARDLALTLELPKSVRGRAVDDTGSPVERFQVKAEAVEERESWRMASKILSRTYSARDGSFELDGLRDGEWDVTADAKGFARSSTKRVSIPRDTAELRLVLPRAATISGVVTDPTGKAAAGASVRADRPDREPWSPGLDADGKRARAEGDGRFEIADVPPGATHVVATAEGWAESAPLALDLQPGQAVAGLALLLRRGGTIAGEVLARSGRPDAGRSISCHGANGGSWRRATSDAAGRFEIERLSPGAYWVQAEPTGKETEAAGEGGAGAMEDIYRRVSVTVADGETTRVVLGAPPKNPVRVRGAVTAGGKPVAGYTLWAYPTRRGDVSPRTGSTDAQGRYEIVLDEPGEYAFNLWKEGGGSSSARHATVPDQPVFELDIDLPVARIAGRVLGPDGAGLAQIAVTLAPERGLAEISSGASYGSTASGEGGAFAFENLVPGTYTVRAGGAEGWSPRPNPTYGRAERAGLEVAEGGSIEGVELRLPPACSVEGVVTDSSGEAVRGAAVFARDGSGRLVTSFSACITDGAGRFRMEGLAPGPTTFSARTKTLASGETPPVTVRIGDTAEVEIRLRPGTILRVFAEDAQGRKVGAAIRVVDELGRDAAQLYSTLDQEWFGQDQVENGRRVGPLPPGRYEVNARNPGGASVDRDVTLGGQAEEAVTLRFPG